MFLVLTRMTKSPPDPQRPGQPLLPPFAPWYVLFLPAAWEAVSGALRLGTNSQPIRQAFPDGSLCLSTLQTRPRCRDN